MGSEALDCADDAEGSMFNESRVGVAEDSANYGENVFDHVIVIDADITAAVGGGLKRCALDIGGEEIEVVKECRKATLTDDRAGILFRDLFECLYGV